MSDVSEPWERGLRDVFRGRFGEDVDAYERTRPVAPDAVFDELIALAGLESGSAVVEIGPGTGQATFPLAERGLRVTALEIDPRLAARAGENLAVFPDVSVLPTSFEAWDPPASATFRAVVACNSFHWIPPALGFSKVARLLEPGGHLILLSTPVVVPPDADRFWWEVQDDWVAVGAAGVDPATKHPDRVGDTSGLVRSSDLFDDPVVRRSRFDLVLSAADHVANLSTQSGVKELPAAAQVELLDRVERRVQSLGGNLVVHHVAILVVAAVVRPEIPG